MIYAVQILDNKFIKIGYSKEENPARRVSELQTGNPFEIIVLFTTYGTLIQEQEIHKALRKTFARIRVSMPPNEWYPGLHPIFKEFLDYLKYGPDAGLAFLDNYDPDFKRRSPRKDRQNFKPNYRWPTLK